MILELALLASSIQAAPTIEPGWEHLWAIADDGAAISFRGGMHVWRVRDWQTKGKNPISLYYDERSRKPYVLDMSQRAHVKMGLGWHWEDDIASVCMRSETLFGTLHNAEVVGYFRTPYPKGSQVVSFVRRNRRGSHPNVEILVDARDYVTAINSVMAFNSPDVINVSEAQVGEENPKFDFAGWMVHINGTAKLRFRRKATLAGLAKNGYWGVNVALSTDRIAMRREARRGEFQILDGPTGRRWSVKLPAGADVGRTVVARDDLYVYAPAKSATIRYSFASKKWSAIPGLAIVCVSGNGKYGAFARIGDRRAVVMKL